MSDPADLADKEIETNLSLALALQLRRGKIVTPENWDGLCVDCGEDVLPKARKKHGYINCLACQQSKELGR